jgi:hypothetical protein
MECNFLEKSPEEFVELFYSDCFPQAAKQTMTTLSKQ